LARSLFLPAALLTLLLSPGSSRGANPSAPAEDDLKISLRRSAVQGLIVAATPLQVELRSSLLRETLTFSDPRELLFREGKITLAIRCRGTPFLLDQSLRPVLTLRPSGRDGGYQAVVESLPVVIPVFGQVDLKDAFPPVEIESLLRQTVFLQGKPAQLDVRIRRIVILPEMINLGATLTLTPAPRP